MSRLDPEPRVGEAPKRRLAGWGFEAVRYEPPAAMLEWLAGRLGPAEAFPRFERDRLQPPPAVELPDLGVSLSSGDDDRMAHARGQGLVDILRLRSGSLAIFPDAIARPRNDDEVETLLRRSAEEGLRIVPWGGGTSVTGGVNIVADERPAVTVDLGQLSGLAALDEASGLATLGAGTVGPAVEAALGERGFTLGHFPQSFELSTVGGWIATHSSGQESMGHGRITDLVSGLRLVAPAGRLDIPALPASATGPDLRHWVTGSEGRYGIITRATMRVRRRSETLRVEAVLLPDWASGVEVARRLTQARLPLCLLRLSDEPEAAVAMTVGLARSTAEPLVRAYLRIRGVDEGCLLLLGAKGSPDQVDQTFERARSVLRGQKKVWLGAGPGKNWQRDRFRHPYLRDGLLDHGYATDTFETAAPWSEVGRVYARVKAALGELPVLCHLSHPYEDGVSLYFTFFFVCPPDVEEAIDTWAEWKRRAQAALAEVGAATSHHHGVGMLHAPWAPEEWGDLGTRMLGSVARELDPEGVMNPHVLLDPTDRLQL